MGFWKLACEAVDIVKDAVRFVGVLLVELVRVEGLVVELAVFLNELLWDFLGANCLGLDVRDCNSLMKRS